MDSNLILKDSFRIFGKTNVKLIGSYLDKSNNNYYFALWSPDTIYSLTNTYLNPYREKCVPVYIFCYDINAKYLTLVKVIGNGYENIIFYERNDNVYLFLNYVETAFVDSLRFPPLLSSNHEQDVLALRLNAKTFQVETVLSIRGYDLTQPIAITADDDKNMYLLVDTYSFFLKVHQDSLLFNELRPLGVLFKIDSLGNLVWHQKSGNYWSDLILDINSEPVLCGNYINKLEFDSIIYELSPKIEEGFTIQCNQEGQYKKHKIIEGDSARRVSKIIKGSNNQYVVLGQFKGNIYPEHSTIAKSIGDYDAFVSVFDIDDQIINTYYFQGDKSDLLVDAIFFDNGDVRIFGYTDSKLLISGTDTLESANPGHYFIYDIKKVRLVNKINKIEKGKFYIYPTITSNNIIINFPEDEKEHEVYIYDQFGYLQLNKNIKGTIYDLDVTTLNSGIYFLKIHDNQNGQLTIKKFIKM